MTNENQKQSTHILPSGSELIKGRYYSVKAKLMNSKKIRLYEDCTFNGFNPKSKTFSWTYDQTMIIIGYSNDFIILKRIQGELIEIYNPNEK